MREEVSMEGMWPRMYNLMERSILAKGQTDGPGISVVSRQPCSRIHGEFSSMCVLERRVFITQKTRALPLPRTQDSRLQSSPGPSTVPSLLSPAPGRSTRLPARCAHPPVTTRLLHVHRAKSKAKGAPGLTERPLPSPAGKMQLPWRIDAHEHLMKSSSGLALQLG